MTAVHITSGSTQDDNDKSSSTRGSVVSRECNTCHHSLVTNADSNNTRFKLKPGENMFDFEGSTASTQSLSSFLHLLAASNVYRMFFAYTQVLQHDTHRCSTAYHKYGHCNRFCDIPCIEETRVHVKLVQDDNIDFIMRWDDPRAMLKLTLLLQQQINHPSLLSSERTITNRHISEEHDYIHANWVDGYREPKKFILTQAPLSQTIDQFWNMVWQEKCLIVVSMIQMFDVNGAEWSVPYIPKKTGEKRSVSDIMLVHCGTRCIRQTYDATVIKATRNGSERRLLHLCYFAWGHRGTPRKPTEVLNFVADLNYNRELLAKEAVEAGWLKSNENSPITIHCLTGVARSATLVALDICLRKLDDTASRPCGPLADIEDVVLRLRTQRAMAMQKAEQYLFLHLAVLEYAVRQRYIADETYGEINLEGFFYEPRHEADESGSSKLISSENTTTAESNQQDENSSKTKSEKGNDKNKNSNSFK